VVAVAAVQEIEATATVSILPAVQDKLQQDKQDKTVKTNLPTEVVAVVAGATAATAAR
jgi:hypothetical protein